MEQKKLNRYFVVEKVEELNLAISNQNQMNEMLNKISTHTRKKKTNIIYGFPVLLDEYEGNKYFAIPVYKKITNPYHLKHIDDITLGLNKEEFIEHFNENYNTNINYENELYIVYRVGKKLDDEDIKVSFARAIPTLFNEYREYMNYQKVMEEIIPQISADFDFAESLLSLEMFLRDKSNNSQKAQNELERGIKIARENNNSYYLISDVKRFLKKWFKDFDKQPKGEFNYRKFRDFVVWLIETERIKIQEKRRI